MRLPNMEPLGVATSVCVRKPLIFRSPRAKALKREQQHGLLVLWLEEKGPAEKSGLIVGDIIVAISAQAVGDPDDLFAALNGDIVGKSIAVEILRGGKPETLQVTVGERK